VVERSRFDENAVIRCWPNGETGPSLRTRQCPQDQDNSRNEMFELESQLHRRKPPRVGDQQFARKSGPTALMAILFTILAELPVICLNKEDLTQPP
jgi:hypothetical protein